VAGNADVVRNDKTGQMARQHRFPSNDARQPRVGISLIRLARLAAAKRMAAPCTRARACGLRDAFDERSMRIGAIHCEIAVSAAPWTTAGFSWPAANFSETTRMPTQNGR